MAKQPRALKTQEEISAVPPDQPILVELPSAAPVEPEPKPAPAPQRVTRPAPQKPTEDDPVKRLTDEIATLKTSNERLARERRDAQAAAVQFYGDAEQAKVREVQTEHDYLTNALTAAQNQLASAKQAAKQAGEGGNFEAQAEAHDQIADARTTIRECERNIAVLERQAKQQPPPQPPPQPSMDVNQAIEGNTALLPAEKDFLKQHPELVLDVALNNELSTAHNRALRQGIRRGSDAYFNFVNEFMGYTQPGTQTTTEETEPVSEPERSSIVSAPVSRESAPSSSSPTRVHLNTEQREMARSMGLTDLEYAAQVIRLQEEKKANAEKYATR